MAEEEKISKFVAAITREANERRDEIARETKEFIKAELKKAEDVALEESYQLIQKRSAAIREEIGRNLSHRELEGRKELFTRREEMTAEIFGKVKDKIMSFASSDSYKDLLLKTALDISSATALQKVTILVKADDMKFQNDLLNLFPAGSTVCADKNILLGGLKVKTEMIAIDGTLDSKLENQKEWFHENCGFAIS